MISRRPVAAVAQRIDFARHVSQELADVLDDFLKTNAGQRFEWKERFAQAPPSNFVGRIVEKTSSASSERSEISFSIDPTGSAHVTLIEWEKFEEGYWEDEVAEQQIEFHLDDDPSDVAACLLLKAMWPKTNEVCNGLRRYLTQSISPNLSTEFDPTPT